MSQNRDFAVTQPSTLLPFLLDCFSGKSRNYVKSLLTRGQVSVDGKKSTDYALPLRPGQTVSVSLKSALNNGVVNLPVIFEDDDIVVIDKPAGVLSIGTDTERLNTAFHMVSQHVKRRNRAARAFIVHRLDRDTSGVLLFAKNERIKRAFQDDWDVLVLRRRYIAVVEGRPSEPEGKISSWLKETKTLMVYSSDRPGDGKLAVTSYAVRAADDRFSLLDVDLDTGRKNQIRVHMHDIGHPVAGDKKYGAATDPFGRLGLHASELAVRHPFSGDEMRFAAPEPHVLLKRFGRSGRA